MNHGEVWTIQPPNGTRWRAVVVSSDGHNGTPGAWPYLVPVVHRGAGDLPPYAAALADPDPVGGVALVAELYPIDPRYGADLVGMLTGASMARIGAALRDLFEL